MRLKIASKEKKLTEETKDSVENEIQNDVFITLKLLKKACRII